MESVPIGGQRSQSAATRLYGNVLLFPADWIGRGGGESCFLFELSNGDNGGAWGVRSITSHKQSFALKNMFRLFFCWQESHPFLYRHQLNKKYWVVNVLFRSLNSENQSHEHPLSISVALHSNCDFTLRCCSARSLPWRRLRISFCDLGPI